MRGPDPQRGIGCDEQGTEATRFQVRRLDDLLCFMQATGMVNDHTIDCFRHKELQ